MLLMADLFRRDGITDEAPPPALTTDEVLPTLLVSWWCTIFSLAIILTRVGGRYIRTERLFREDIIMAMSIFPLLTRMAFVHVVLIWGTNNVQLSTISPNQYYDRSIGSRLVLASRIFYAAFIWTAKLTVSEFLKRMTAPTWNRKLEIVLKYIRAFLLLTFIAVVISTLAECHPFDHYWQVAPDPGPGCRNGYAQLLTMGISDCITDLLLIFFPMPVIIRSTMPFMRKVSLLFLFSLSFILLAIAAYRIPAIIDVHGLQQRRSLWASIEILAATAVTNSVIISSFIKDKGVKKRRYKDDSLHRTQSVDQPSINRNLTIQHWGNDEDQELFRACAGRLNSIAGDAGLGPVPRAPDKVEPAPLTNLSDLEKAKNWPMANQDAIDSLSKSSQATQSFDDPSVQMTFSDVGGILESDSVHSSQPPTSLIYDRIIAQDFASSARPGSMRSSNDSASRLSPASWSRPIAQSTRQLLGSQPRHSENGRRTENLAMSNGRPVESDNQLELNDAGGLLS